MSAYWATYAEQEIARTYGVKASFLNKGKTLSKFGRTTNADAGVKTTVAEFQGDVVSEVYATDNTVDYAVSDDAADTGNITIEGQRLNAEGGYQFVTQTIALTGLTPVPLTIPLVRATRIFRSATGSLASPAADLVGNVYVYDSTLAGGVTDGVPVEPTATKVMIMAGSQNSNKCATSISSGDLWAINMFTAGIERVSGAAAKVDIAIEYRAIGGVWQRAGFSEIPLGTATLPAEHLTLEPWAIIPPNSDVRMVAISDTANVTVHGTIRGPIAIIGS